MITRKMSTKASNGMKSIESARLVNNTISSVLNQLLILHDVHLIMAKTHEKLQMNTAMNSITFWSVRLTREHSIAFYTKPMKTNDVARRHRSSEITNTQLDIDISNVHKWTRAFFQTLSFYKNGINWYI